MFVRIILVLTAICLLLLFPLTAYAQTAPPSVRATVPFDFLVGDKSLQAGDYSFQFDTNTGKLQITNLGNGESIFVFARDLRTDTPPTADKLSFVKQGGNKHVLHRVWSTQPGHAWDILHGSDVEDMKPVK